jgi:hypothetical protein
VADRRPAPGALLVIDPDGRHHVGGDAVEIGAGLLPPPD